MKENQQEASNQVINDVVHGENITGQNIFGGDVIEQTGSTPESRGDIIVEENPDVGDNSGSDNDGDNDGAGDDDDGGDGDEDPDPKEEEPDGDDDGDADDKGDDADDKGDELEGDDVKEPKEKDEEKKPASKNKVPVARLNKEIEKRKTLEARIKELEANPPAEKKVEEKVDPEFSKEQFKEMNDAILDGDTDKAFELMQKMNKGKTQEKGLTKDELRAEVKAELKAEARQTELVTAAASIGEKYPEFVSGGDDEDVGLIEEVVAMRDMYVGREMSPAKALEKAANMIAKENGLKDRTAKKKAPVKKETDVDAKVALAKKERGKLGGESTPKEKRVVDIGALSEKQFGALSQEDKARARGDYL